MFSMKGAGLSGLLEEKGLTFDQRRRITATAVAVELIAVAVGQASSHKLAEEMANLTQYVDAIEAALKLQRP